MRMNRPEMVALLLELGADPLATDGSGYPAAAYAMSPGIGRSVMEMLRARGAMDLFTAVALGEWDAASRLLRADPGRTGPGGRDVGVNGEARGYAGGAVATRSAGRNSFSEPTSSRSSRPTLQRREPGMMAAWTSGCPGDRRPERCG